MRRAFDAAVPPPVDDAVRAFDVVCFYIGGDTPHVWSDAEIAAFPNRYRLPIFVRNAGGDPVADATQAVSWALRHSQPKGTLVALDFETRVDGGYVRDFDSYVVSHGYRTVLYGSFSTVLLNPEPSGGYWTADWDGQPSLQPQTATATQYNSDQQLHLPWDQSVVSDHAPLWDTRPTPLPPPPLPNVGPAFVHDLVWAGPGWEHWDPAALEWQQQMLHRGWRIVPDGFYGPASRTVCEAFQGEKGLQVDGIVGPVTWRASWALPVT